MMDRKERMALFARMRRGEKPAVRNYRQRNLILKRMGFPSYKQYLNSELWKSIRRRVLSTQPICGMCGCAAYQVHHVNYDPETLRGDDDSGLVATCRSCHVNVEFRASHRKRSFRGAVASTKSRIETNTGEIRRCAP